MLEAALFLEKQDKASMYLWVLTSNRKAISFYERLGGKPLETVNDFDIGDRERRHDSVPAVSMGLL